MTIRVRISHSECSFTPNFAKLSIITRTVYDSMVASDFLLRTILAPEMFEYYVTGILWARLLYIKNVNNFTPLTINELLYRLHFVDRSFSLPEPIYAVLMTIGNIEDVRSGYELFLADHTLPTCMAGGKSGYHAERITAENHNLFEELPSLGVIGDSVMALAVEPQRITEPDFHFLPDGAIPTSNLVGYFGPVISTQAVHCFLQSIDISASRFEESVPGTRFNIGIMERVSRIVSGNVKCYRVVDFCSDAEDIMGLAAQLVETRPLEDAYSPDGGLRWTRVCVRATYASRCQKLPDSLTPASCLGFQLYKEPLMNSHDNWCCVETKSLTDEDGNLPSEWIDNRNERRKRPTNFTPVFTDGFEDPNWETVQFCRKYLGEAVRVALPRSKNKNITSSAGSAPLGWENLMNGLECTLRRA